jgi:hypothetical protein
MAGYDLPAYLNNPPVYDSLFEDLGEMTLNDSWSNWFGNIVNATGVCITHDFIVDPTSGERRDAAILRPTEGSTAERDMLENSRNGSMWYNTDTNQFNFRQNGMWVTFTPVPA